MKKRRKVDGRVKQEKGETGRKSDREEGERGRKSSGTRIVYQLTSPPIATE